MSVIPEKVLFVDDDPNILRSFKRQFHNKINIQVAEGGEEALRMVDAEGPFAVIVSDMRMPVMDGATLLTKIRDKSPDTIRIILTGQSDLDSAIKAVNEGQIFRFLTKPCPPEVMGRTLVDSLTQYRLVTAEKVLLENTLTGAVKLLTELLGMVDPAAAKHANGVRFYVGYLVRKLGLPQPWEFDVAAMLSRIGGLTLPPTTMHKILTGIELTDEEKKLAESVPAVSAHLMENIPRLDKVAAMVRLQGVAFSEINGEPYQIHDDRARVGGHLLKVANALETKIAEGLSLSSALEDLKRKPREYDPRLIALLSDVEPVNKTQTIAVNLDVGDMRPGMLLAEDVCTHSGAVLVKKGFEVTESILIRLRNYSKSHIINEPIRVIVQKA